MISTPPPGVPRIIHQTWHSSDVPPEKGDPASWRRLNPGWDYRFWDDADLLAFMRAEFPDLVAMFRGYPRAVQRADLARYCLLSRFGGVYADIDTRCMAPLEALAGDSRVILCEEPPGHHWHASRRGLPKLWFNGTMASPPGHPFWEAVIGLCRLMYPRREGDVLESTGPLLLSAAVAQWGRPDDLALNSCHLFAGPIPGKTEVLRTGPYGDLTLSEHFWQGSWFRRRHTRWHKRGIARLRQARQALRPKLRLKQMRAGLDLPQLTRPLPEPGPAPEIAILIPVRDGASFLRSNLEQIRALDFPRKRLHILYGEGDSTDDTPAVISMLAKEYGAEFASFGSIRCRRDTRALPRAKRWRPRYQRSRRAAIARARNDLLAAALPRACEWFLWLDVDVIGLPPTLLHDLLAARAKIVTPDCVLEGQEASYDLNAFLDVAQFDRVEYFRHIRFGLFQPPAHYHGRRHLDDLRYLPRVPLDGVGGTALLVHADVHRAGLVFPEIPYRDLLETEAFGTLARDLGLTPVGLPNLRVIHARS